MMENVVKIGPKGGVKVMVFNATNNISVISWRGPKVLDDLSKI